PVEAKYENRHEADDQYRKAQQKHTVASKDWHDNRHLEKIRRLSRFLQLPTKLKTYLNACSEEEVIRLQQLFRGEDTTALQQLLTKICKIPRDPDAAKKRKQAIQQLAQVLVARNKVSNRAIYETDGVKSSAERIKLLKARLDHEKAVYDALIEKHATN